MYVCTVCMYVILYVCMYVPFDSHRVQTLVPCTHNMQLTGSSTDIDCDYCAVRTVPLNVIQLNSLL